MATAEHLDKSMLCCDVTDGGIIQGNIQTPADSRQLISLYGFTFSNPVVSSSVKPKSLF